MLEDQEFQDYKNAFEKAIEIQCDEDLDEIKIKRFNELKDLMKNEYNQIVDGYYPLFGKEDEYIWFMSFDITGYWKGYVIIPENHLCSRKGYDHVNNLMEKNNLEDIHGGLSFSDYLTFGFDCAHCDDTTLFNFETFGIGTYKDYNFVRNQINVLINNFIFLERFEKKFDKKRERELGR